MEFKLDEIYTFKLNSGEELVGKVTKVEDSFIYLQEPVSIGPSPQGGLGLVPSMFTYNQRIPVRLNTYSVALAAETDENVRAKYVQATTGLTVPEKKVILG
jgi:hypothetical protein